jgi:hypothetical protein
LPFRVLARLLSKRVPKDQEFGKFREKEEVMYLPAGHPIFDPKNDRLFSKEAALKAFKHVNVDDEKMRGRRRIAEAFLIDAQRDGMSWWSRSDCAFEAVYLYVRTHLRTSFLPPFAPHNHWQSGCTPPRVAVARIWCFRYIGSMRFAKKQGDECWGVEPSHVPPQLVISGWQVPERKLSHWLVAAGQTKYQSKT